MQNNDHLDFNNEPEDILSDIPKVPEENFPLPDAVVEPVEITPPPPLNEEVVFAENPVEEVAFEESPVEEVAFAEDSFEEATEQNLDLQTNAEDFSDGFEDMPQDTSEGVSFYVPHPAEDPYVKSDKKGLWIFFLILGVVIISIGSMALGYFSATRFGGYSNGETASKIESQSPLIPNKGSGEGDTSSFPITQDSRDKATYDSIQNVAAKTAPSVVNITTYNSTSGAGGYASGIIMSKDGYILTNDHIYASIPNAKFLITLYDGTEYKAKYVSGDTRSDIAILKITDPVNDLVPAVFGKSSELKVGETVVAIGQSSGLSGTVSEGIVSALDRRVRGSNSSYSERHIQTTAAINPGNSGGALVNMQGQVIGVTSSKYVDENVEGICFAIPIDSALKVVSELQQYGKVVSRAKLGITYTALGTVASEINKLPTGLYIQDISSESPLYNKGFKTGDVITHINGEKIKDDQDVLDIIENTKVGQEIKLTIFISSTAVSKEVSAKLVAAEGGSSYTTQESSSPSGNVFDVIPNPDNK